jgi:tetratricopeptide (TPR) repeat protein
MKWFATLLAIAVLAAAEPPQLALSLKAEADFDRVMLAALPPLHDTASCVQSQAALLPLAAPSEVTAIQYRRGYCALAGATLSRAAADFATAAGAFEKAIQFWPESNKGKRWAAGAPPSGLRILAILARREAGTDEALDAKLRQELASVLESPGCSSILMPVTRCESLVKLGHQWLGFFALQEGRWDVAAQNFASSDAPAWIAWLSGKQEFQKGTYAQAAAHFRQAVGQWDSTRDAGQLPVFERLEPRPDLASAYAELGGAQLLAGDVPAALASLNRSLQENPAWARAYFLRALAKETAGQKESALADYNLASRTAFAEAKDLASGEAHLYRGILLYRRGEFARAEEEFSSAMNFEIPATLRADAEAWRHLAAVASGSCGASRQLLEQSLAHVTPYFPQKEAKARLAACPILATDATLPPSP